jgi:hypothetical protein
MHWRLKALAFRALELPGGSTVHYGLQRYVTRTWPRSTDRLEGARKVAERLLSVYSKHMGSMPNEVIEIGAGRDLAVPLNLVHMGVKRVRAYDVERLAKFDLVRSAGQRIFNGQFTPTSWGPLEAFGVSYRAPSPIKANDRPVDCTCSNEVLEHVPAKDLPGLLSSLRTATTGLSIHSIDYSDHYARGDKKLSRLNFLKYSDEEWERYNPPRHFVNRLRHSDYLRLFTEAGFEIIEQTKELGEMSSFLEGHRAKRFIPYQRDDVRAIKGLIVAKPV